MIIFKIELFFFGFSEEWCIETLYNNNPLYTQGAVEFFEGGAI